jgi:hypothetical protein
MLLFTNKSIVRNVDGNNERLTKKYCKIENVCPVFPAETICIPLTLL